MKTTKRALFSSVIALILCFSMLVGTTFAWFTDSVESGTNQIVAGNLDVELYHEGNQVTNTYDKLFEDILWEPGAVAYENITVKNEGTLALKYQLSINFTNENTVDGNGLSQALKVAIVEGAIDDNASRAEALTLAGEGVKLSELVKAGELQKKDDTKTDDEQNYAIIIWWEPSDEDDKWNVNNEKVVSDFATTGKNELHIDLGIKLVATQLEAEVDSFGPDYDNGAFIPVAPEALPEEGEDLVLNSSAESNVTVNVPATVLAGLHEDVTSLTIAASAPIVDTANKTVTFSTIELLDQNGKEVDLSNSTAKVTVTLPVNGAFADGDKVDIYHDGEFVVTATVADGKISYEVSHFCEVSVKVAEEVVLDNTIDSVKEFMAFAAAVNAGNSYQGQTVVLGADIDLAGVTWTPIGTSANPFKGTFDGNGKVIKNLSVLMAGKSDVGLFGNTQNGEIKNVTVENAKVAGRLNVGVVAGTPYTSKYTNITVKGHVEVDGMAYVGGVGGKNAYANWNNVTVNVDPTSYVNANSVENGTAYRTYVGGVVGFNGEGGHSFTNITSNINVIGSTCDIGGAFGIGHYNNKFENVTVTGTVTGAEGAYEVGGIAGVWHNENGTTVTFTKCTYNGESNVSIVGAAYGAGTGKLIVDGVEVAASATTLQTLLNAATGDATIELFCDITGNVTVAQKPDVKITIDGNGNKFNGVITVDGKSGTYTTAGLTIKNVNFKAESISADACIRLGDGTNATRYTCNVTVENCTFDVPGAVGVKSYTGGDKKVTITGCTATANAHSLCQLKGVDGVLVEKCTVNSKNGMNFNNSDNVVIDDCVANVKGYAVRFGESAGGTGAAETYTIKNSTLKSACNDGDAVIILRGTADNATLTITNTTLEGATKIANTAINAKVIIDEVTAVFDGESLKAALAEDNDVIFMNDITMAATESNGYGKTGINVKNGQTINGNGFTLKVTGAGATWDSAISTTGGVIKNLTVAQGFRGIFVNHNSTHSETVVLDNVTIQGPTYTISCDQGMNQNLVATNCTINGWTSYAKTIGTATFTNCSFGKGAGYQFCRPYSDTEFVNCTFSEGYKVDTTQATVTFTDCTGLN